MKVAKLFDGSILKAVDADYNSFKQLTRCLRCGQPVILRAGNTHEREYKTGKKVEVTVCQHFAHRKATSLEFLTLCEERANQITESEIKQAHRVARGQREEILKKHFWDLLSSWCDHCGFPVNSLLKSPPASLKYVTKITNQTVKGFLADKEGFKEIMLLDIISVLKRGSLFVACPRAMGVQDFEGVSHHSGLQVQFAEEIKDSIEWDYQERACSEVYDFITLPRNKEILNKLVRLEVMCILQSFNESQQMLIEANLDQLSRACGFDFKGDNHKGKALFPASNARNGVLWQYYVGTGIGSLVAMVPWHTLFSSKVKV